MQLNVICRIYSYSHRAAGVGLQIGHFLFHKDMNCSSHGGYYSVVLPASDPSRALALFLEKRRGVMKRNDHGAVMYPITYAL
jgi:hypothetical protein